MSEPRIPLLGANNGEEYLQNLRQQAVQHGEFHVPGVRPAGAPFPHSATRVTDAGYYGQPLLKVPAWTWEVPIYFFTGGFAGASSMIGAIARWSGADPRLVRDARCLATIGGSVSPALLISDLGMPSRFLHMLRVFKLRSPMSVGSWTLVIFSSSAAGLVFLDFVKRRRGDNVLLRVAENVSEFLGVISGAGLSTYTGVLLGATAVPVWNKNVAALPIHFAASGMGAAASILELRGNQHPALNALAVASATAETVFGASVELRKDRALKPLKQGKSGWLTRIGGLLAGPLPLALRLLSLLAKGGKKETLRKSAAVSAVAGSLVTRFAWVRAGHASASDPTIPLELPESQAVEEAKSPVASR